MVHLGGSIPKSIDEFRTEQYRVFSASPYFKFDLTYEIKWHENYLKKLHQHRKNPSQFYRSLTSHKITDDRLRHFKEHVIEAIPFHKDMMDKNKQRLETIKKILPRRSYKGLVKLSMRLGYCPEYFVYDKLNKFHFFVIENILPETDKWISKTKKFTKVIVLENE